MADGGGYDVSGVDRTTGGAPVAADLVVVDVYMPRDSGLEQLRRVRSAYPGAPIIATSGQFSRGLAQAGATAGALGVDALIAKPFDRETLLHAVRSLIGLLPERTADARVQRAACAGR